MALGKSQRISYLTDWISVMKIETANSSQGLAPHTPKEGFLAFFFYGLSQTMAIGFSFQMPFRLEIKPMKTSRIAFFHETRSFITAIESFSHER